MLKERVIEHFVAHADEVWTKPSFRKVRECGHVLDELMEALLSQEMPRPFSLGDADVDYDRIAWG